MGVYINKKDITGINQDVGANGKLSNESSLDFALSTLKQKRAWLYELSYLVRSLVVDHSFEDGNKRTALIVMLTYFDDKNVKYDKQEAYQTIYKIAKGNVKSVNKIARMIKNVIR